MTDDPRHRLDRRSVSRAFNAAAPRYDEVAVLQREVGDRLSERLDALLMKPRRVLDIGAGTGRHTGELMRRYRRTPVVAVDVAPEMLRRARRRAPWFRRLHCVRADMQRLPFADDSFDLVFSNLTLQWATDPEAALGEMQRVTAPGGAVMFTTFGPLTLRELRTAWGEVDDYTHVSLFPDVQRIGDAMLQAGFSDPVLDTDLFTLTYRQPREVMRELKALGAGNATAGRSRGLCSPHRLARVEAAYAMAFRRDDGSIPATYEVVYGHAWGAEGRPQRAGGDGEVRIDVSSIGRRP